MSTWWRQLLKSLSQVASPQPTAKESVWELTLVWKMSGHSHQTQVDQPGVRDGWEVNMSVNDDKIVRVPFIHSMRSGRLGLPSERPARLPERFLSNAGWRRLVSRTDDRIARQYSLRETPSGSDRAKCFGATSALVLFLFASFLVVIGDSLITTLILVMAACLTIAVSFHEDSELTKARFDREWASLLDSFAVEENIRFWSKFHVVLGRPMNPHVTVFDLENCLSYLDIRLTGCQLSQFAAAYSATRRIIGEAGEDDESAAQVTMTPAVEVTIHEVEAPPAYEAIGDSPQLMVEVISAGSGGNGDGDEDGDEEEEEDTEGGAWSDSNRGGCCRSSVEEDSLPPPSYESLIGLNDSSVV